MKDVQSKRASLFESVVSNLVGFLLTIVTQFFFFVNQTIEENLAFSTLLLGLHIIRSYFVRRVFNARAVKLARRQKALKKSAQK